MMQLNRNFVFTGRSDRMLDTILWRSISTPASFFRRTWMSCAVIEPNTLPVSPVSRENVIRSLAMRRLSSSPPSFSSRASRSARFFFEIVELAHGRRRHLVSLALGQELRA